MPILCVIECLSPSELRNLESSDLAGMGGVSAAGEAVELFRSSEFSNGLVPVFEAAAAGVLRPSELLVVFETLIKINNYFKSIN